MTNHKKPETQLPNEKSQENARLTGTRENAREHIVIGSCVASDGK